jgi:predicted permease
VLAIILTVIAATAVGAFAERRANHVAQVARTNVLRAMLWVLVPFVAYVNVARAQISVDAGVAIAVALLAMAAAGALTWRIARGPLGLPRPATGAAIVSTLQANSAYLGLPLCAALFSEAELAQAVAYDALTGLPMLVLGSFTVGALFGTEADPGLRGRLYVLVRNPVLLAVVAGLLVPDAWAPEALVTPSHVAIYALLPLGFFAVGVTLATEAEEGALPFPPPMTPPVAAAIVLRLLVAPALLYVLALPLIDLPAPYLLLAAMPCGVNTIIVAHAYGLDMRIAAGAVAWSTAIVVCAALVVSAFV